MIIYYDHKWDSIILFSSSCGGEKQHNNHHLSFPSTHQRKLLHQRTSTHCFSVHPAGHNIPQHKRTLPSQFIPWTSWTLLEYSLSCFGLLLPLNWCIWFFCLRKLALKSPRLPSWIQARFHQSRCCCIGARIWYRILDRNLGWCWSLSWLGFHLLYGFASK